jgi:hypothetical protein
MDLYFYIFERLTYEKKPIILKSMPQYKVFTELRNFWAFYFHISKLLCNSRQTYDVKNLFRRHG